MDPRYQQSYPPQRRRSMDNWTLAVIAAAGLAGLACVCAVSVLCIFVILPGPRPPATLVATLDSAAALAAAQLQTPAQPATPTFDPASVGKIINPYVSDNLSGMTVLQIDVLDPATGTYTRKAQLTGADLDVFAKALNISVQTVAPNTDCPDHVRLSITRADSSVVTIAICLKGAVILRGLPDMGGADAPMGPFFIDTLLQYLPPDYQKLLES